MADNDLKPMTDADIASPPASTEFEPAVPLKGAHVEFDADTGGQDEGGTMARARQALHDGASKYGDQITEKVRGLADMGRDRAGGLLDQLAEMLTDAAGQVDDRLGAQYGDYARNAAGTVQGFSEQVRGKDLDALMDDARELVRKSPAVAIGAAAAFGFLAARVIHSGLDARHDAS